LIFPYAVESLLASLNPQLTPEIITSVYLMLIGRVGFLTVVILFTRKRAEVNYDYAEESVSVS
jgi:Trk-type K+ transport system membrane component